MQQIINILVSSKDISSCLSNCSNQGVCKLSINQTYMCECNGNFQGKSCQTDNRPCSQSNKCLNNGMCVNSLNLTSFSCTCPEGGPFYGQYCENMINLCENETCSMHGYCTQIQSEIQCKCYNGFEGENCEIESSSVKAVKNVQWTTTIIAILFLALFWIVIISNDLLNFFKIGHKRVDINEWKSEKMHGEKDKPKKTKKKKKNEVKHKTKESILPKRLQNEKKKNEKS